MEIILKVFKCNDCGTFLLIPDVHPTPDHCPFCESTNITDLQKTYTAQIAADGRITGLPWIDNYEEGPFYFYICSECLRMSANPEIVHMNCPYCSKTELKLRSLCPSDI